MPVSKTLITNVTTELSVKFIATQLQTIALTVDVDRQRESFARDMMSLMPAVLPVVPLL